MIVPALNTEAHVARTHGSIEHAQLLRILIDVACKSSDARERAVGVNRCLHRVQLHPLCIISASLSDDAAHHHHFARIELHPLAVPVVASSPCQRRIQHGAGEAKAGFVVVVSAGVDALRLERVQLYRRWRQCGRWGDNDGESTRSAKRERT